MKLARSAQAQLDTAYGLFDAVRGDPRAAKVLVSPFPHALLRNLTYLRGDQPILSKLKARAEAAMSEYRTSPTGSRSAVPNGASTKDDDEELGALQGRTRLISRKSPAASSPSEASSQASSSPREVPDRSPVVTYAPPLPGYSAPMDTNMPDAGPSWQGQGYAHAQDSYERSQSYEREPESYAPHAQEYVYAPYQPYADMNGYWAPMGDSSMMQGSMGSAAQHQQMAQSPVDPGLSPIQGHPHQGYAHYDPVADPYTANYMHVGHNGAVGHIQPDPWHTLVAQFHNS